MMMIIGAGFARADSDHRWS